ncbi:F0F1 ATP synthase subunit gamma [Niveibacterium terrae]|uniref:F0F1 ATP synthase subunit gamma n=1 Tax=Niveibacterium terrae TaxID=3373598 RepID=UPI003A8E2836
MSRRRELARRLETLSDIAGILSAMKGLALMEIHRLADFLVSQRTMVASIELAAADFLAWHAPLSGKAQACSELCVIVGSEQGFCGDFNESLIEGIEPGARVIVVGRRLADRLGDTDGVEAVLPGATVADEVPAVLLSLTRSLDRLLLDEKLAGCALSALSHAEGHGIRRRQLLPLPAPASPEPAHRFAAELNLPPAQFLHELSGHYLYAMLNEVLYSALLAENRQRLAHMEGALRHLDDECAQLKLSYNRQRQEEITEDIEIILLAAEEAQGLV